MERLRHLVLNDPTLRATLLPLHDRAAFSDAVAEIAHHHGLVLAPEDINRALIDARRRWHERWV